MPQRLDDAVLEKLLAEKLSSSTALKGDLEHYYRIEASHDDKNYTFLRRTMDRYLERKQQEKNREDTRQMWKNKAFQPLQVSAPVVEKAAPAKAKPKAKDGRDRSPPVGGKATSKGKGSTKGDASQHIAKATDGAGQMFCWFFHHSPDGCRRGKDCLFSHQTPKKEVLEAMQPPRSRSPSPKKGGGKGAKGGKGKASGSRDGSQSPKPGPKRIRYCFKYQTGECTFGDKCRFEHEIKPDAADRSPPASPRAKSKPKAKGKATPAPTPEDA